MFLFLALAAILVIGVERFYQNLVGSQFGIIPVKSESNWPKDLEGDTI